MLNVIIYHIFIYSLQCGQSLEEFDKHPVRNVLCVSELPGHRQYGITEMVISSRRRELSWWLQALPAVCGVATGDGLYRESHSMEETTALPSSGQSSTHYIQLLPCLARVSPQHIIYNYCPVQLGSVNTLYTTIALSSSGRSSTHYIQLLPCLARVSPQHIIYNYCPVQLGSVNTLYTTIALSSSGPSTHYIQLLPCLARVRQHIIYNYCPVQLGSVLALYTTIALSSSGPSSHYIQLLPCLARVRPHIIYNYWPVQLGSVLSTLYTTIALSSSGRSSHYIQLLACLAQVGPQHILCSRQPLACSLLTKSCSYLRLQMDTLSLLVRKTFSYNQLVHMKLEFSEKNDRLLFFLFDTRK